MSFLWLGKVVLLLQLVEWVCIQFASLDRLVENGNDALLEIVQTVLVQWSGFHADILLRYIVILQPRKE